MQKLPPAGSLDRQIEKAAMAIAEKKIARAEARAEAAEKELKTMKITLQIECERRARLEATLNKYLKSKDHRGMSK
jgi:dynactin complex subunit